MSSEAYKNGKVTLVGAGPGEKGLLTVKGLAAVKNAEVVVYDRLVGSDILNLIPNNAEKINVGKESGNHIVIQEEINKILLQKALEGKNVIRLKGGDPFLFGRGAEELELLYQNNVCFEVIPGVTSALSVPLYAGIPVTHRNFSSSVHIITGHKKENSERVIDYEKYAKLDGTLVFLMGISNIENIAKGLIKGGMSENMPCVVIEKGTTPFQRKIVCDISSVCEKIKNENIKSPAIIVVGEVCSLNKKFDWFEKLPLFGKNVVITRPVDRAAVLSEKLIALGANVLLYPCIETRKLSENLNCIENKIKNFDWVVFTSPKGVKVVFEHLFENGIDGRVFAGKKIAAVGSATKDEIKKYGIIADIVPNKYSGKELGKALAVCAKFEKVILLRAANASTDITEALAYAEIKFEDYAVYQTINRDVDCLGISEKIQRGIVDYVTFTSPSTVRAFTKTTNADFRAFCAVCIGDKTASEAEKYGMKIVVSENSDENSVINSIVQDNKEKVG